MEKLDPMVRWTWNYHVMEQLEIDWKYASGLQTADNELLARTIVKEVFRMNGLEVSFQAKPILGVAGSGEHDLLVRTAHFSKNSRDVYSYRCCFSYAA